MSVRSSGGESRPAAVVVGDRPGPDGAWVGAPDHLATEGHVHTWPFDATRWCDLAACERCGLIMLKLIVNSSAWVVRRVEHVTFHDESSVRRRVSIDYIAPQYAMTLRRPDGEQVQVLPLAIMRRKSLVNFDFRDQDERALSLLGLRQNQALTLGLIQAWAAATLYGQGNFTGLRSDTKAFLDDIVAGDQTELWGAYIDMWNAEPDSELLRLSKDAFFRHVLDRLADSFVLYGEHQGPPGERRLIKFSYDEPLTLQYRPSYVPYYDDAGERRNYDDPTVSPWSWTAVCPAIGFTPTRILFPVPAAESADSFHFEISAPPDVSIVSAVLLAGRPKPEKVSATAGTQGGNHGGMKDRGRRRPSFDAVGGKYPTVDLHVAGVPYGSMSRVQVEVEARVTGWFATAVFATWLSSGILAFAWLAKPEPGVGSTLLMSFAAGLAVLLIRQDPHRLVTRLLSKVRILATFAAVLALAAAVIMASNNPQSSPDFLFALFLASLFPTGIISLAWLSAFRRWSLQNHPVESLWEHHRPRLSRIKQDGPGHGLRRQDRYKYMVLAEQMEKVEYPYDWAYKKLGFDRSAIRVDSSERGIHTYPWDKAFEVAFHARLGRYLRAVRIRNAPSALSPSVVSKTARSWLRHMAKIYRRG